MVVCGNIGMKLLESAEHRSVAIVMAGVIAGVGPAQGLITGVVLYFLIEHSAVKRISKKKQLWKAMQKKTNGSG